MAEIAEKVDNDERMAVEEFQEMGDRPLSWRPFPDPVAIDDPSVDVSIWIVEPGTYKHHPIPEVEVSYCVEGEGKFEIDGHDTYEFAAGTLVAIPRDTAGELTVTKTVRVIVMAPLSKD